MTDFRRFGFMLHMLFSGLPGFLDKYWNEFEEKELKNCRTDEGNGRNHCVYEERINNEKYIDAESNPNGATIFSVIVPKPEHPQEKEILCISAPNGYAKEFFAKRLCLLNQREAETQDGKVWWNPFCFQGRVPVIIKMQDINELHDKTYEGYSELCLLCMISMRRFASKNRLEWHRLFKQVQWSEKFEKKLLIMLSKLLDMGKLFILFEKDTNIYAEELKRIAEEALQEKERGIRKNLLVFVFDDERDNPFDIGFYSVKLSRLSRWEVMNHIEKSIGGRTGIWKNVDMLFEKIPALMIPDCLLFVVETHQNSIQNSEGLRTAAELYRDCIDVVIKDRVPENQEETLRQLQNYALLKDSERYIAEGELKKLMPVSGKRNHLLHENGQFRFEGCREYLIAESIYYKLNGLSGRKPEQVKMLLDNIDDNIVRRLIEITVQKCKNNREGRFALNNLLKYLFTDTEETVKVDLDVLIYFAEYTIDVEDVDCEMLFIDRIKRELLKPVYDNRIFNQIAEANKKLCAWKINNKLKNIYLKSVKNRTENQGYEKEDLFNRRFLFYYGTYNKLDDEILSGFKEKALHSHVKYHLARALIDNAIKAKWKNNKAEMEFFRNAQEYMENEEVEKDAILKGQRLALKLIFGEKIHLSAGDEALIHELEGLLSHEDYWKRAHAADTLGHLESSDIREIPRSLIKAVAEEMERENGSDKRNKVIGYTTEAVCVFFYISYFLRKEQMGFQDMQEVGKGFGIDMLRMIDLDCFDQVENRELTMSVFAVLAEGALYLTNQEYNEMPNFSGRHISNSEEQWDENTKLIVRAFECARSSCNDMEQKERITLLLRDFRRKVDEIREERLSAKKRITEIPVRKVSEASDSGKPKNDAQEIPRAVSGMGGQTVYIDTLNFNTKEIENMYNIVNGGKEGGLNMNVTNNGPVTNQQNIESRASGTQVNEVSGGPSITELVKAIGELVRNNCKEKQTEIDPVMTDLSVAVNAGKVCRKDEEDWKERFLTALSAGSSVATITSTPWWSMLTDQLHQFFSNLPF